MRCPGLDVTGVAASRRGAQEVVLEQLRTLTKIPNLPASFLWPSDTIMVCEAGASIGRVLCAVIRGRRQSAKLSLEQMARATGFPNMSNYARHEYVDRGTNPTFSKLMQVLSPLGGAKLVIGAADHQIEMTDCVGDGEGPSGDAAVVTQAAANAVLKQAV